MKKIFTIIISSFILLNTSFVFSATTTEDTTTLWAEDTATTSSSEKTYTTDTESVIMNTSLSHTERFYLTELKDLRTSLETLKREIFVEIQAREIWAIDKALSYSSSAVSFFSILISIMITTIWIVWWKTIWDIKKSTKESMDRETTKIIESFQQQIAELEKEQKINILWRQFNSSESDKEKLQTLDKIYNLKPSSQYALIERANIYLSMWLYEKVIEISSIIITSERKKHLNQALFNRACAYCALDQVENTISDLKTLLEIAPTYKENIISSEILASIIRNPKVKSLFS